MTKIFQILLLTLIFNSAKSGLLGDIGQAISHGVHSIEQDINNTIHKILPIKPKITYSEKVLRSGFNFEEYKVETEDGYILTVWRIPGRINETITQPKKPILLQHGLLDDSYTFLALPTNESLALTLADRNFDVWLANSRGNIFSAEYIDPTKENPNYFNSNYWNFTFQQMAQYDLPATIDFVRNKTGFSKIDYVGHSQGTFIIYLNFMMNPSYLTDSIDRYVALGNVFSLNYSTSIFIHLFEATHLFTIIKDLSLKNLFNFNKDVYPLIKDFCDVTLIVCDKLISSIVQTKPTHQIDWEKIENLFNYEPGGTSTKNLVHWLQVIKNNRIALYDYGTTLNLQYYNQTIPPAYNLTQLQNFDIKSFIIAGNCDPFAPLPDQSYFKTLINLENKQFLELNDYGHLDYIWGQNAYNDIYLKIFEFLK